MKRIRKPQPLTPDRLDLYRNFSAPVIAEQLAGLETFASHRALFRRLGDTRMAAAAERAWVQDAILVAAMPAQSRAQAHKKAHCLQGEIDRLRRSPTRPEVTGYVAMIAAAIAAEKARWEIAIASSRTH